MYDGLDPRHTEHNFGRGSPKEHLGKVWFKLTKWMGGDTNVKLCIHHFLSLGLSPTPLGNLFKKNVTEIPTLNHIYL
jgi:hypothetical protein